MSSVPQSPLGGLKTNPKLIYSEGFSLDGDTAIVAFGRPVYLLDKNNSIVPAKLYLSTSYGLRDEETFQFEHHTESIKTGNRSGAPPMTIIRGDVALKKWINYEDPEETQDNKDEVIEAANFYLKQTLNALQTKTPGTVTYAGFKSLSPNGVIQQIRWSVDEEGYAYTEASVNSERLDLNQSYVERRAYETLNRMRADEKAKNARKAR